MTNKVLAAHDKLALALQAVFPGVDLVKDPGGHVAPKARAAGALTPYLCLASDQDPEVLGVLLGPLYDLKVNPVITFAFVGLTKDERSAAAYAALDLLETALSADRSLAGTVSYADIAKASDCDADGAAWLAGGLDVEIGLLIDGARTRAG